MNPSEVVLPKRWHSLHNPSPPEHPKWRKLQPGRQIILEDTLPEITPEASHLEPTFQGTPLPEPTFQGLPTPKLTLQGLPRPEVSYKDALTKLEEDPCTPTEVDPDAVPDTLPDEEIAEYFARCLHDTVPDTTRPRLERKMVAITWIHYRRP